MAETMFNQDDYRRLRVGLYSCMSSYKYIGPKDFYIRILAKKYFYEIKITTIAIVREETDQHILNYIFLLKRHILIPVISTSDFSQLRALEA